MEMIYGKLNRDTILAEYTGLSTKTATVKVDNSKYTIAVDVHNVGGSVDTSGCLLYNSPQYLSDVQLNQLYSNLKLKDYLNDKAVLLNKDFQVINGDVAVNGQFGTSKNYIDIHMNDLPLKEGQSTGIRFREWGQDRSSRLFVDNHGILRYDNDATIEDVVLGTELKYNKFTYWNGSSISSRDILPKDINTQDYEPTNKTDLVTKQFVDKSMRQNMNYAIVKDVEEFGKLQAWEGRRVMILEEVKA